MNYDLSRCRQPSYLIQIIILQLVFVIPATIWAGFWMTANYAPSMPRNTGALNLLVWMSPFVMYQLLIPVLFRLRSNAMRSLSLVPIILKYLHCPSCGYSLETTKPDPADHCTVCPECGAAWKLSPLQHS